LKKFALNEHAHKKILSVATKLCDIVGLTLGPRGRNVIIEREDGRPQITNDGVTIAREVIFEDKFENMASRILLQASQQTNTEAGDGTTSAIVLATEILKKGFNAIKNGASPILLKEELLNSADHACNAVSLMSRPVKSNSEIRAIATNSCASEIDGTMVTNAFERVGKDGLVVLEENHDGRTILKHVTGCEVNASLANPYFIENAAKLQTEYENGKIVLVNDVIKNVRELLPLLELSAKEKIKLVIVANDFSSEVINMVLVNKARAGISVILVKLDETGERRRAILDDIAALTGSTVISGEVEFKP